MHAPVPARKQPDTFQLHCLIPLLLRHIYAEQVQTHSPPGTLTNAHTEPASPSTAGGTTVCHSSCLSVSVCLSLSLPFSLSLPCFPPSSVSVSPPQFLSSTTRPSGDTCTHAHTRARAHTHTHTHAGLLCPRLTDQQHHRDLSTRRTLFAESGWGEKDKTRYQEGADKTVASPLSPRPLRPPC